MQRFTYHSWFDAGAIVAIRQLMDQPNRPASVGSIDDRAPYRPRGSEVPAKA